MEKRTPRRVRWCKERRPPGCDDEGGQSTAFLKGFKGALSMQPSSDHFDEFVQEQLRLLRATGHAPQEAADIFLQAQEAILEACQKLLEQCENGEPLPEQKPPGGAEGDPDEQS